MPSLLPSLRQAAAVCLLLAIPATSQSNDPDQPLLIEASPSVDENLFALRLLADIYAHWPDLKTDHAQLRSWFSEARRSTSTMLGQIRTRGLEPDLEMLYNDCLRYMSATESYLSKLDLIENQNNTRTAWDLIASLYDGYKASGEGTSTAGKLGFSDENAANAGKLIGAANAAGNFYSKSQARGADYRTAVSEEGRKLEDVWNQTLGSLGSVSRKLSLRHGWAAGEAGFDGFQSPQVADLVNRSPRDPFLRARYADALLNDAKDAPQCIKATRAYLDAARLVPSDRSYDSLRLQYVAEAMNAAVSAPSLEAGNGGYSARPSSAPAALTLARTYLAMNSPDATGVGHVQLARALAFIGRYSEAAASATDAYQLNKAWGNDPGFCYRYAKLMSLTGRMDLVGTWLTQSFRDGWSDVASARVDPDLAGFRSVQGRQLDALTAVKWGWEIKYGLVWDDVIIKNNSPFDMTNVKVQVHVRKGGQRWDPVVKCPIVKAGSTCRGDNVMSITGDSYDEATADLSSDQN